MKFRIKTQIEGKDNSHWEIYDKNVADPEQWGKDIIEWFNKTRTQGERKRKYLGCEVIDKDSIKDHNWEKTNIYGIKHAGRIYDKYKCIRCGVTAKRYGVGGGIFIDSKFGARVYARCDTALNHLKQLKKKGR